MKGSYSTIYFPQAEWTKTLRQHALESPPTHDRQALLSLFREMPGFYAERLGAVGTWDNIPPLEKPDIASIPVADPASTKASRTSGTSGFQVTIRNNQRERQFRRELLYRPQSFYDLPGEIRQVVFVDGNWCGTPDMPPKYFARGDQVYRTWFAGAGGDPAEILALLHAINPHLIRGISSAIVRFIDQAPCSTGELRQLATRYVAPGGEFLRESWRTAMQDAFDATVLDRYGSTESGAIAWQCPYCAGYHANTDEIVIEADPDGLLVTPLFVSSQPLLRYRLGDVIEFDSAPSKCRVRLPVIRIQKARRDDWIVGKDGKKISPLSFQFEQVPNLQAWRLHQRKDGSLALYFESDRPGAAEVQLRERLAGAVPGWPIQIIEGLWKLDRGGKFKRVSSDMNR